MNRIMAYARMAAAMAEMTRYQSPHATHAHIERRASHPWDTVQLTKTERKGKSPEEIQALRKKRWNEQHPEPKA